MRCRAQVDGGAFLRKKIAPRFLLCFPASCPLFNFIPLLLPLMVSRADLFCRQHDGGEMAPASVDAESDLGGGGAGLECARVV